MLNEIPGRVPNFIGGQKRDTASWLEKFDPHSGEVLTEVASSSTAEVALAVETAAAAQVAWAQLSPVQRGTRLLDFALALSREREGLSWTVAKESGKSLKLSRGETDAAVACGTFFSGEGQRLFGRTLTSMQPNRRVFTVREPLGVAGLLTASNTPLPNLAWKVFPALVCGNAVVLKCSEDTPVSGLRFAELAVDSGIPEGVLNVIQGSGPEAGAALVAHRGVQVVSFTGSAAAGRSVGAAAGARLARCSLELGGKNPFVVCSDADIENAVNWAVQSSFSNAGQRCAAASRIIVDSEIYDVFRDALVVRTRTLKLGVADEDDLGPVVSESHANRIVAQVAAARARGARILAGGGRSSRPELARGFYVEPTLIEDLSPNDELSSTELFGPVAILYRVQGFQSALQLANSAPYALTASIHTRSFHRVMEFTNRVHAGMVTANAGTHGSEPHFPFGGPKDSGNGTREPGTEALDVYSNLKNVVLAFDPSQV
jgi:acyl-CoA reductase-like NAD-dependent aldehyde dehydrogenase